MPLVRIITRLTAYPTKLVNDLRARGFEVETRVSSPDAPSVADLEVTMHQCAAEEVPALLSDHSQRKDVYIVAGPAMNAGKIHSIAMIVLGPAGGALPEEAAAVPPPLAEIYAALLHQRNGAMPRSSRYRNLRGTTLDWSKVNAAVKVARRRAAAIASDLQESSRRRKANAHAGWMKLWGVLLAVIFEGINELRLIARRIRGLAARGLAAFVSALRQPVATPRSGHRPDADYDLVPSMFNLTAEKNDPEETPAGEIQSNPDAGAAVSRFSPLRIGAAIASLALAGGLVVLFLHLFSNPAQPATPAAVDTTAASQATQAPTDTGSSLKIQETAGKAELDLGSATPYNKPTRKHAHDDYFDQVVVRRFPAQRRTPSDPEKDGIKRRVVVD